MNLLNRKQAPPLVDAVHYQLELKPCEQHKLDNGVPVYMIDAGAEDIERGEDGFVVYTKFVEFGHMAKFLETKGLEAKSSELQYIPLTTKELSEEEQDEVLKLIEALESDDDVQSVFHSLA